MVWHGVIMAKMYTPEMVKEMISPFSLINGTWHYKGQVKSDMQIMDIANELYRDFCISLLDNRPLTPKEIEYGVELEKKWQHEQGIKG